MMTSPEQPLDWTPRTAALGQPAAPVTGSAEAPSARRRRPNRTIAILAGMLAVAALISGALAALALRSDVTTAAPPAASPAPPTNPAPSSTPSPTPSPIHALGETAALDAIADVTAYAFKQPVAPNATKPDQPGFVWAAIDVKACAGAGDGTHAGITVTNDPWGLTYADSTYIEHSPIGYQQFPQPSYPWGEHALNWGQCVRGWITFAVPADRRPVTIEYRPGGEAAGQIITWKIS